MNNRNNRHGLAVNIISLCCVFLFMAAAAMIHGGMLFGHQLKGSDIPGIEQRGDTTIVNTTDICPDVTGYSGPVPVEIAIVGDRVVAITPLQNSESPAFFKRVTGSGIFDRWIGLTPQEALQADVDGVTGATFSSKALIENVRSGLSAYEKTPVTIAAENNDSTLNNAAPDTDISVYAALAVLIAAMSLPLFWKNSKYRLVQQILNAGVLGFWAGTFVDYIVMLRILGSGISLTGIAAVIPLLMLVAAFIYPLFGKEGYYCAWVCPLGSIQELASRCNKKHRLRLSPRTVKILTNVRMILWGGLMLCLWTGLWMSWIDYELFSAFLIGKAAVGVVIAGAAFVVLSVWIPRPYCRFVCPTGTLLRMSQDLNTH